MADVKFSKPTWRVLQCGLNDLESEIRRRTWYDLVHVTQVEKTYTLFFRLKPEQVHASNNGEHRFTEGATP